MNFDNDMKFKFLSEKQKHIVRTSLIDGYMTISDIFLLYDSKTNAKRAIRKLLLLGFLKENPAGVFNYAYEGFKKENLFNLKTLKDYDEVK